MVEKKTFSEYFVTCKNLWYSNVIIHRKALLEYSQAYSLTYCLWLLLCYMTEWSVCSRTCMAPRSKMFTSRAFTEKFAEPWFKEVLFEVPICNKFRSLHQYVSCCPTFYLEKVFLLHKKGGGPTEPRV